MSDVKRYYMNEEGDPLANADGRWVRHDEHAREVAHLRGLLKATTRHGEAFMRKAECHGACPVCEAARSAFTAARTELTSADAILNRKPTP